MIKFQVGYPSNAGLPKMWWNGKEVGIVQVLQGLISELNKLEKKVANPTPASQKDKK